MDQTVLEPEPEPKLLEVGAGSGAKNLDAWSWSRSPKFVFWFHNPGCKYCEPYPCFFSASILKQVANWSA